MAETGQRTRCAGPPIGRAPDASDSRASRGTFP